MSNLISVKNTYFFIYFKRLKENDLFLFNHRPQLRKIFALLLILAINIIWFVYRNEE